MFSMKKYIVILVIISCSYLYIQINKNSCIYKIGEIDNKGIVLKKWRVLGPFQQKDTSNFLNVDNLRYFNINEDEIDYERFVNLSRKDIKEDIILHPKFQNKSIKSKNFLVDINQINGFRNDDAISGNEYLGCIIKSKKEQKARLIFSSDDGAKVWLNNKEILEIEKYGSITDYENYITLNLKKGINFLLVKVYNGAYEWQVYVKIVKESQEGILRHKNQTKNLLINNFLSENIINDSSSLYFNNRLSKQDYVFKTLDSNGKTWFQDTISIAENSSITANRFKSGLNTAYLINNEDTLSQLIYKGDLIKEIQSDFSVLHASKMSKNTENRVEAYIYRFNHLLKKENRGNNLTQQKNWERKIINIHQYISQIKKSKSENPLIGIPNWHIGTFISEIDEETQYYLFVAPKNYNHSKKYPLMIFMPAKLFHHQQYLESMRVADLNLIENLQELADRYNICVFEPFCREVGKFNFNGIEETDFFESLQSAKQEYNIDTNRIYLTGTCAGCSKVIQFAAKYPFIFAKLGMISPVFNSKFRRDDGLDITQQIDFLKNISLLPTLIIHSAKDNHAPISNSDDFVRNVKKLGLNNVTYNRLDNVLDLYYWNLFSDDIVKFLLKDSLRTKPLEFEYVTNSYKYNNAYCLKINQFESNALSTIHAYIDTVKNSIQISSKNISVYTINLDQTLLNQDNLITITNNGELVFNQISTNSLIQVNLNESTSKQEHLIKNPLVKGPFYDALINKFILVYGSQGDNDENLRIKQLTDSINNMWHYKYFNNCMMKRDIEVTSKDIQEANLVLIGNQNSNYYLKHIIKELPIDILQNRIVINNDSLIGSSLGFYMVYPNPHNEQKYIAIIGYNNKNYISLGSLDMDPEMYLLLIDYLQNEIYADISCYGWNDYKIWNKQTDNHSQHIEVKGNFNLFWR